MPNLVELNLGFHGVISKGQVARLPLGVTGVPTALFKQNYLWIPLESHTEQTDKREGTAS